VAGAAAFITGQTTTRAGAGHRSPHRPCPVAASSIDDFRRGRRGCCGVTSNLTPERATERAFERAWVIWPLFAYRRRRMLPHSGNCPTTAQTAQSGAQQPFPICPARDAHHVRAVIYSLKTGRPRLSHCRLNETVVMTLSQASTGLGPPMLHGASTHAAATARRPRRH